MAKKRSAAAGQEAFADASGSAGIDENPMHDSSSPFYVHPSENPAMVLVSSVLDGRNYYEWARSMRMALSTKNKSGFIDGSIVKPDRFDPMYPIWERCNNLILSWIQRAVTPSIARSVMWMNTAFDVWEDLRERFSQGDLVRVFELQQQVSQLMQGAMNVTDYLTELMCSGKKLKIIALSWLYMSCSV